MKNESIKVAIETVRHRDRYEDPNSSVELDTKDVSKKLQACVQENGIAYMLAFGPDCSLYGQTDDLRRLIMALFPPNTWKKDRATNK